MPLIRSILHILWMTLSVIPWATFVIIASIFVSSTTMYWMCAGWLRVAVRGGTFILGIKNRVTGMENLPTGENSAAVLLVKHQSTWETFCMPTLMPHPLAYVFKKELLYVPFFGWSMARMDMIHIDRSQRAQAFNKVEIEAAMKRQGVKSIEKGDVVLFHTGWTKLIGKDNKRYGAAEPGLGKDGASYLASLNVAAVGADTWGLEVIPFEKDVGLFEIHQILLAQNGIYILENMETAEMVKDKAWEFLFTLGPSRITGAVQAIINPIAIK